jgi:hypothetical protein
MSPKKGALSNTDGNSGWSVFCPIRRSANFNFENDATRPSGYQHSGYGLNKNTRNRQQPGDDWQ